MPIEGPRFHFSATGIGSVPFLDVDKTCQEILSLLPEVPFWPQFVNRSPLERMGLQFTEGLLFLEINEEAGSAAIARSEDRAPGLTAFYERYLAGDINPFRVSDAHAPGLHAIIKFAERVDTTSKLYIKGQTVGPITLAAGLRDAQGGTALYQPDLLEAIAQGLSMKALWQVRELAGSGRRPIIFIDEPYLAGYGSAFVPIERIQIVAMLSNMVDQVRQGSEALIGIHCCGNTDWSMILEARPDIVSFDAYGFMDHFLLYREDICRFLTGGGTIAWGIVPTSELSGKETSQSLVDRLLRGIDRMEGWGLDRGVISERSLLTPSCGMGTLTPEAASFALDLLSRLPGKLRETFSIPGLLS